MSRRTARECNQGLMKSPSGTLPDFGAIFMSNRSTKEECLKNKLFGLSLPFASFVEKVKIGMVLFLFEHDQRKLYGVFEATSDGALNIVPHAYSSSGKQFPAQVQISTIWRCHPLLEHDFRDAIKDNYYAAYKFNFGLSKDQVHRLMWLFDSRKVRIRKSLNLLTKTTLAKSRCESLGKGEAVENDRSITADIYGEKLQMNIVKSVIVTGDSKLSDSSLNASANSDHTNREKEISKPGSVQKSSFKDTSHTYKSLETPGVQYSSVSGTGFGSISLYEIGAHPSYACKRQSITILDSEQNVDVFSNSITTDTGDYIPLPSPDHCDPIETETTFLLLENMDGPIIPIIPESSPSHQAVDSSTVAFPPSNMKSQCIHRPEHGESDYNNFYQSMKGLYSDTLKDRNTVFSRLTLASKSIVQEKKDFTTVEQSVKEIMDKLQQRHNNWRRKPREAKFTRHESEGNNLKKRSVFSRLSLASKAIDDQDPQDAWTSERIAKDSHCLNLKRTNQMRKTQIVATGRPCADFYRHNSFEKQCKTRRLVRPLFREKSESDTIRHNCSHVQMPPCEPPSNRSGRVDDELNQSYQKDLVPSIRNPLSCEFDSKKAGKVLTNKDLGLVEMASTVTATLMRPQSH